MTIGERLFHLRTKAGMTQEELGNKLGVRKATIMKYEKGLIANMKRSTVENLAIIFGVSPTYILGLEPDDKPMIPLYDASCGTGVIADGKACRDVPLPDTVRASYAIMAKGDSMIDAGIDDGDIVYVREADSWKDGQLAVVVSTEIGEAEAMLKRIYRMGDSLMLQSANALYPPVLVKEYRVIGIAVSILKPIR